MTYDTIYRNLNNQYGDISYVAFGPENILKAERYDMSDVTLNLFNYEPIYGAILTQPAIILPEYERIWTWTPPKDTTPIINPPPVINPPGNPPVDNPVPEPGTFILLGIAIVANILYSKLLRS